MKFRTRSAAIALLATLGLGGVALAQLGNPPSTIVLPVLALIGATDLIQDIPNGAPVVGNQYVTALQLAGYGGTLPTRGNALIGGDATQNLWQRGTTGPSTTTTYLYEADRFFAWSGTSTAMTVAKDTTAADLPATGYSAAFKMARTASQTGLVQMCHAQIVATVNSYQFQGTTAEFDFHATAGANFSAASSDLVAYIVTGTGSDDGAQKLAWGLNTGGGGSTAWAGQANATAAVIPISTTSGRYAAVATIPAGATEIAAVICYTPVGTAGANDYVAIAGEQLVRNPSLAGSVSATAGYSCSANSGGAPANGVGIACTTFDRTRNASAEAALQYPYYYQITEGAAGTVRGVCRSRSTTVCSWDIKFPVAMRAAPTMSYTAGFSTETTVAGGTLGACTGLAADTTVSSAVSSVSEAFAACTAGTVPAAGTVDQMYDDGGSGAVKASAEL